MTFFQALILAIVQGLTEFLPLSSSGHLVVFQEMLGFQEPPLFFDILVHLGTLGAIFVFFRKKIFAAFKNPRLIFLLGVGSLPVCLFSLLLGSLLNQIFTSLRLAGVFYLLMALILFSTRFLDRLDGGKRKKKKKLGLVDALVVGIFQALAIFPGISRSGSTIVAGLWRGIDQETAFDFSFLLGGAAVVGAFGFSIFNQGIQVSFGWSQGLAGMIVAGLVGYFSLKVLKDLVKKKKIFWFGFYCLLLGLIILRKECWF